MGCWRMQSETSNLTDAAVCKPASKQVQTRFVKNS